MGSFKNVLKLYMIWLDAISWSNIFRKLAPRTRLHVSTVVPNLYLTRCKPGDQCVYPIFPLKISNQILHAHVANRLTDA